MAPKKKQEKMSLGTFLQDDNYGSWADEMEDMPMPATSGLDPAKGYGGPTRRDYGSYNARGGDSYERRDYPQREQLPLPTSPPYTAHLANLSFDVTQGDVQDFFQGCEVTNVRIVENKDDSKPKGFGYVEFGTLDGLKQALTLSGMNLAGRSVRISIADPPKGRPESNRDFSDWSRKGPLPDLPQNQRRVSDRPPFGSRNTLDNMSDAGSERGGSRRAYGGESDGKVRDFSNWERRGPLSPASIPDRTLAGAGRQMSNSRRDSPSWGEGRSQDGSRPPRREYTDRPMPVREPTVADMDTQWRSKMRPDAPPPKSPEPSTPAESIPSSPAPEMKPTGRPRLQLQKRTVSEAVSNDAAPVAADSKASPFGAAKPIDTAAREREVEEKRLASIAEKKEAEEKEKTARAEEKRLAKEKADAAAADESAADNISQQPRAETSEEQESQPQPPKFELLRRQASGSNDMIADEDVDENELPNTESDPAVKPREVVQDMPKTNGSWRQKDAPAQDTSAPAASSETAALEEDGWSMVSKPQKKQNNNNQKQINNQRQPSRRHQQPSRAIAS